MSLIEIPNSEIKTCQWFLEQYDDINTSFRLEVYRKLYGNIHWSGPHGGSIDYIYRLKLFRMVINLSPLT